MTNRSQRITTRTRTQVVGKIPDKMYFRIGEVASIVGVKPYVLRYWETEFPSLKPQKSRTRQRMYRRRDVELLLKIKDLLYERKYTIAGARQLIKTGGAIPESPQPPATVPSASSATFTTPLDVPAATLAPVSAPAPAPDVVREATVAPALPRVEPAPLTRPGPDVTAAVSAATEQLALNLKVSANLREGLRRGLQDIVSLCDQEEESDDNPLDDLSADDRVEDVKEVVAEARDRQ